ncbi:DUF4097 domain-containing protein [Marinilongibacter aquaticus]|uniref:DUF4097 domain-containing protein n=1 Tax=Marinilongibacter aquaticus TaxID=2975157 RepID=UPI0021BDC1BC|nr:DUF4097 domain-containing protein [Marinilongibacter aquaticus]UBM58300.1 DUF4097 domain-containing protein [Marinilongibacter aquaticus]
MKKFLLVLMTFMCLQTVQANENPFAESPYLVKTIRPANIRQIEVLTSAGVIEVNGESKNEARVEVFIRDNHGKPLSDSEIEERLKDYTLKVEKEGNALVCLAKRKDGKWAKNGLSISFRIYSPKEISTDLKTSGGGIRLKNLEGNLKFATSGGGLDLEGLRGNIEGRTSGGGIKLTDCHDKIDLVTSGGGIIAQNASGSINLATSGGGLVLEHLSGKISAHTSGGGIKIEDVSGELETATSGGGIVLTGAKGKISASTSGGGIVAEVEKVDERLELHTSGGNISVELPLNQGMDLNIRGNKVAMDKSSDFNGVREKNKIQGRWNGGGAKVDISTSSGSVAVN